MTQGKDPCGDKGQLFPGKSSAYKIAQSDLHLIPQESEHNAMGSCDILKLPMGLFWEEKNRLSHDTDRINPLTRV